jgi:hypothetical protein
VLSKRELREAADKAQAEREAAAKAERKAQRVALQNLLKGSKK